MSCQILSAPLQHQFLRCDTQLVQPPRRGLELSEFKNRQPRLFHYVLGVARAAENLEGKAGAVEAGRGEGFLFSRGQVAGLRRGDGGDGGMPGIGIRWAYGGLGGVGRLIGRGGLGEGRMGLQ